MNDEHYLADTYTFIALLNKNLSVQSFIEGNWYFSFISEIELLGKPGIKSNEIRSVRDLLNACTRLVHSDPLNELTIKLRQESRIKLPDAIIAATSIHYDLPLFNF